MSNFTYTFVTGNVTITGYLGLGRHVVVPSVIDGFAVTTIGDYR